MDVRRLEQLLVIASSGNLTTAARLLRMTPGGLSKSMDVLESDLGGQPLFVRDGRAIQLSDFARSVVTRAPEVIAAVRNLGSGRDGADERAKNAIKIGTFEVFSTYFMGEYMASFAPKGLDLVCREMVPGQIEEAIISGAVDVGLSYDPVPAQGLDFLKIARCRSATFGVASIMTGIKFPELPFAAPAIPISGSPTGVQGLDGWPDDKVTRTICYKVDAMETALELCRNGMAVIFAPRFVISLHNKKYLSSFQLVEITPPDPHTRKLLNVTRDIYLIKRKSTVESQVIKNLTRAVRQICAG